MDNKEVHETDLRSSPDYVTDQEQNVALNINPLAEVPKGRWERSWPTIACGAGLFSDGYLNGVIGSVSTMLQLIYGDAYTSSSAKSAVPSIAFAGTVSMLIAISLGHTACMVHNIRKCISWSAGRWSSLLRYGSLLRGDLHSTFIA